MRRIAIEAQNMPHPILGKVTRRRLRWWKRRGHILVADSRGVRGTRGYAAVLVPELVAAKKGRSSRTPVACVGEDSLTIEDGDIVLLEPAAASASILYEAGSSHNAIFVTNRCNCACIMCPQPPQQEEASLTALNMRLIQMMAPGPEILAMTGGEPTLLRNDFLMMIDACKRRLPRTHLVVLTNGRLFRHREYVKSLASIGHPSLLVAVPLYSDIDSVHDRIMGADGAFADTIVGLHNLALYGLRIELRTVVLRCNYERLLPLSDFVYHNLPFAVHVAIMALETTGNALQNLDEVWIDPSETTGQLQAACEYLWRRKVPVSLYNHQLCVVPERLWPLARRSISAWKNVFFPECDECSVREQCCGFFKSATAKHPERISPVRKNTLDT